MNDHLREVIERALERELATRKSLRPHAQLGIASDAHAPQIERAYVRLRARYDSISIGQYGPAAVAAAHAIAELLASAHAAMLGHDAAAPVEPAPRPDETCRALQTLRAAIDRRLAEARAHEDAGRLTEALRVYETLLLLDRGHEDARRQLRTLRAALTRRRLPSLTRMLSRVFGRPHDDDSGRERNP